MTTSKLHSFMSDSQSDSLTWKFETLCKCLFLIATSIASRYLSTPKTSDSGISKAIVIAMHSNYYCLRDS